MTAEAAAEGGVTSVHEADVWVDPAFASRAEPRRNDENGILEWRLKALLPCLWIYLYFWFPDSTLFQFLTARPLSVRGEQKIQTMPGSALLRLSCKKNRKFMHLIRIKFCFTFRGISSKTNDTKINFKYCFNRKHFLHIASIEHQNILLIVLLICNFF